MAGDRDPEAPGRVPENQRELAALPVDPGLCGRCRHLRLLSSGRSTFARCAWAERDPAFPRYPRLPVLACAAFTPRA